MAAHKINNNTSQYIIKVVSRIPHLCFSGLAYAYALCVSDRKRLSDGLVNWKLKFMVKSLYNLHRIHSWCTVCLVVDGAIANELRAKFSFIVDHSRSFWGICLSVCLSYDHLRNRNSFLVWRYVSFTEFFRSTIKVIGSRSRSRHLKNKKCEWPQLRLDDNLVILHLHICIT